MKRMELVLPRGIVRQLFDWHGGQSTAVYALASTGQSHTVSPEMIEDAITELSRLKKAVRAKYTHRKELERLIGDLETILAYPEEYSYDG